ncbi:MAG: hypothetical protein QOF39_2630, partial [Frankiales bacterium]|nr:hypothetical protein [Frankiales bacterium]
SRGSTSARERARHRVRTFTAVGAAGAIAGTAVLTAGLALSPSTATLAASTANAPSTLTGTNPTTASPTTTAPAPSNNNSVASSGGS